MKKVFLLFGLLIMSAVVEAQTVVPVGTVIPVSLGSSIDANHSKPGQKLTARIMQDVPLNGGAKLEAGTRVIGEVLAASPASGSSPATVTFRFNQIEENGRGVPVATDLRALASPLEVDEAQTQLSGDDRGSEPDWSLTLILIGGNDVVYRETGKVMSGDQSIGTSVYAGGWGVLSRVSSDIDGKCRGEVGGNDKPQALWVFSHDACGVYGDKAVIKHAGRENSDGRIEIASAAGDLKLRSGSAMLLRVELNGAGRESAAK